MTQYIIVYAGPTSGSDERTQTTLQHSEGRLSEEDERKVATWPVFVFLCGTEGLGP